MTPLRMDPGIASDVAFDNLEALLVKLQEIVNGTAQAIGANQYKMGGSWLRQRFRRPCDRREDAGEME